MREGKPQGLGEAAGFVRVLADLRDRINETATFFNRGLSERTIKALASHGIDASERLLFKSEAELRRVTTRAGFPPTRVADARSGLVALELRSDGRSTTYHNNNGRQGYFHFVTADGSRSGFSGRRKASGGKAVHRR
jgi:hypothetical protein